MTALKICVHKIIDVLLGHVNRDFSHSRVLLFHDLYKILICKYNYSIRVLSSTTSCQTFSPNYYQTLEILSYCSLPTSYILQVCFFFCSTIFVTVLNLLCISISELVQNIISTMLIIYSLFSFRSVLNIFKFI